MLPIRVIIADADRNRHMRERLLRHASHITLVAQATNREEVLSLVSRYQPRVLMLDLSLCEHGSDPLAALRAQCPQTKIFLLPMHESQEDQVLRALGNGARGYLTLETLHQQLGKALHGIDQGEAWVPRKMLGRILDRLVD